jgi:DNA processing protein
MVTVLTEREAWIVLNSVPGVGEATLNALLTQFRAAADVLEAGRDGTLEAWNRLARRSDARAWLDADVLARLLVAANDPATALTPIADRGLWTLTALDADYPRRLRDLDPPPAVIHGLGDRYLMDWERTISIVGTRRPTPAGRALSAKISSRASEAGAVVISGLAIGIDGAAHAAAVEKRMPTVGVIGAGHDQPGPRAHGRLRDEILATGGALISEHHPTVHAAKGTFPRRNRIIAALGDATIVVEAPRTSGALNTATHALGMGRPVFVAPGRVGDWSTQGSLKLLREWPTHLIAGVEELIEDLGYYGVATGPASQSEVARDAALAMLGPTERAVAHRVCTSPAGLDVLVADTGLPPGAVSSAVTLLLMRGWVQTAGPAYIAAGPLAK